MNNDEFKKLQAKWYKKLERSGFKDIEKNGMLRSYEDRRGWRGSHGEAGQEDGNGLNGAYADHQWLHPIKSEIKEHYYRIAGEFLHKHPFKTELERQIWELHSDGISMRQIKKSLSRPGRVVGLRTVFQTINRLKKEMLNSSKSESPKSKTST